MTPIPLRSILKPDRGYVCLSCLLKQQGIRPRRGLRFQSTTTHSATSSTTDSGFAVEGGALKHLKTKSSEGGLLSNVDAKPHPHKTEDQSGKKDGGKGKEGQQIVRVHVGGSQADGQTKKKKRKKVKKGTRPASKAQNGTQQDTKGTEQVTDAGDPSTSGKLEGVETKDQATGNGRRRPTRVMHIRREVVLPSRPRIRKLLSSIAFTITKVEGPGPGSDGQQERGITIGHQIRGSYNKVVDSEQKVAALKSLAAKRPQEEQDQNSASSTNPKPIISGQISTGSTMTTATTGAKDVLEPSKKKKQKSKERFSVENGEKSSVLGSLRAVVEAQKQTLKAKDKEEKVLESKAKGRKKASTAGNDGKGMHPETDQTKLPKNAAKRSQKLTATNNQSGQGLQKSISEINGHKSLKDALQKPAWTELKGTVNGETHQVEAKDLHVAPVEVLQPPVPSLSYGLERVLFNPGVYHVQDPRSRVFNFDPYLQTIMPVAEFDFNALKEYITSSRDKSLKIIAEEHGKRYVGSSSSMTGALAHFHFLLSQWRQINTSMLSQGFPDKLRTFTALQRCPSAIFLRWKEGTYAIDADKEFDTANVLSMLGKSMEKLLTLPTDDYERYRKSSSEQISDEERNSPESFHYCTMGDFLMRSQLDAYDARLPGTGMFDLKTRAVVSIRMDAKNYQYGVGYQIKTRQGEWESFEREYFDMIRSAFLKYSLQVRMGRMDGIFVAFHNTERIFGFQYVSLPEMDSCLHGQWDTSIGDQEFKLSLTLLNKVLDRATKKFPEQSIRIHFETRDVDSPFMYIFAEPVTEKQVQVIQSKNRAKIEEFERTTLDLNKETVIVPSTDAEEKDLDEVQAESEQLLKDDELASKSASRMPQFEDVSVDEATNEFGTQGTPDTSTLFNSGPLFASESVEAVSETPATSSADEVDEDEVNHSQVEANDLQDESDDAGKDEEEESPGSEVIGRGEISAEPQPASMGVMGDGIDSGETTSDDVIQESPDLEAKSTHSDDLQGEQVKVSEVEGSKPKSKDKAGAKNDDKSKPLLAMTLTIRNMVNGKYVARPERMDETDKWSVEYSIAEVANLSSAWSLYRACQTRRRKKLDDEAAGEEDVAKNYYLRRMRELSQRGREWRNMQDEMERLTIRTVLDQSRSSGPIRTDSPSVRDG